MQLENHFRVAAPVEDAWRLLNDVPEVVPCMPGAELVEVIGENAWKAALQVKLGPIALRFLADVTREQRDEATKRVVLAINAREARGRGNAEATITSTVVPEDRGVRVDVVTELVLRGPVAQYGGGVVVDVASRLTEQFAERIAAKLETAALPADAGQRVSEPGLLSATRPTAAPVGGLRLLVGALLRSLLRKWRRDRPHGRVPGAL
ncbi:MAG: SRPBCC family protein [Rhodospirillales bacterium]|nr:SRPBCC family protein [Rhodospirillales bacterium]